MSVQKEKCLEYKAHVPCAVDTLQMGNSAFYNDGLQLLKLTDDDRGNKLTIWGNDHFNNSWFMRSSGGIE